MRSFAVRFLLMTRRKRLRSKKKQLQNDEETAKECKRRKFLGFFEGKTGMSTTELKKMNHRVGGDGGKGYLEKLQEISKMMSLGDRAKECLQILEEEDSVKASHRRQMGQIRTSHSKSMRRDRAEESRPAHLRLCSSCNKNFFNLSSVPGCNLFSCSVCRRKSKVVDPASSLNIDSQTQTDSVEKRRIFESKRDLLGRTPDTPVKIDSSSEGEDATYDVTLAMSSCGQQFKSDLQCAVKRVTYPSRTDPEAIDILASDIQRLEPSEFLNDTIIDFYIRYIQRELLSLEGGSRFHFFNSFFYKKLSSVAGKKTEKIAPDFSKILNWTRGTNIFEKDYLIIPVHGNLHWSLAIICFPKYGPGSASHCERCILHLDSMTCGHESRTVFHLLRRYIVAEWKDTYGGGKIEGDDSIHTLSCNVIPAKRVPVPLQENESDCGLFLLHFIRKFVENAPRTMKISDVEDRLEALDVFGRQWFSPIEASNLRVLIQEQLRKLFAEQESKNVRVSSNTFVGIHGVVKPRNLGAEYREEAVTC